MNIPNSYAKKWFEYAIDGYRQLIGEKGRTTIAEKEYYRRYS